MRILLFSEKSDHTRRLIQHVLAPLGYEIILLHQAYWESDTIEAYQKSGVSVIIESPDLLHWKRIKTKLGKCYAIYRDISNRIKKFQPDAVMIQYVNALPAVEAIFAAGHSRRLILGFWGSDLLRQKKRICLRLIYPLALKRADVVTFDSLNMLECLHGLYGKKYDYKVRMMRYYNPTIDLLPLLKKQYTREEMRACLGLPQDGRILLSVGYNGNDAHNHLKITQAIAALPQNLQKKIFLIYPMTYGVQDEDYYNKVDAAREKLFCESVVLQNYLTRKECSFLYLSVDVFVHAQNSDAYSQTFVDYIYSGVTVFQANWLHYPEIDRYGLKLYEFADYQELTHLLMDYLNEFPGRCLKQTAEAIEILRKTESTAKITKNMKSIVEGDSNV